MGIRLIATQKSLRSICVFFVLSCVLNTSLAQSNGNCVQDKEKKIAITHKRISVEGGDEFSFVVQNNFNKTIYGITLGEGEKDHLRDVPFQKAKMLSTPDKWYGRVTINPRTTYRSLFWFIDRKYLKKGDFSAGIKHMEKKTEFKVFFSSVPEGMESQYYMDGTKAIPYQEQVLGMPFKAYLTDGTCVVGYIKK